MWWPFLWVTTRQGLIIMFLWMATLWIDWFLDRHAPPTSWQLDFFWGQVVLKYILIFACGLQVCYFCQSCEAQLRSDGQGFSSSTSHREHVTTPSTLWISILAMWQAKECHSPFSKSITITMIIKLIILSWNYKKSLNAKGWPFQKATLDAVIITNSSPRGVTERRMLLPSQRHCCGDIWVEDQTADE